MRQSETRIPELPNQDDFLERWYDWHRGYRIIKHDDGSEEHQPMLGERLMDTAIGHLPRTLGEVQSGILENVNDQVNVFVDSIPSEPDDLEIDPEDRLFDPLSSDLDAPNMTSPSENSILQDLTSFLTELETHLHNLEDSLRTNRLEDFLIPAESEYGFNVQNHQATTYEAISDASHTYQATLTLLASTMRELQAREFLLRRNRNTETFAGEELRQRAEELWQLAEESRGRAEALEQAQESQQQDEESRQRDEELLRALSTPNTLYMHIVTYRRILHFTRGRLNRLEAMSSQSGTAPEPTADVLATWTFRDRDTLLSDNVPFPQTTSLRAEEVEINHSSFSRNPRTVQREALDDTDSSDEFDDEFDRIHSEDDEEQDTLVVKNRGLDKDGWPEALKEEDLVVKLDCKICYAQLASITVIPCGESLQYKIQRFVQFSALEFKKAMYPVSFYTFPSPAIPLSTLYTTQCT